MYIVISLPFLSNLTAVHQVFLEREQDEKKFLFEVNISNLCVKSKVVIILLIPSKWLLRKHLRQKHQMDIDKWYFSFLEYTRCIFI